MSFRAASSSSYRPMLSGSVAPLNGTPNRHFGAVTDGSSRSMVAPSYRPSFRSMWAAPASSQAAADRRCGNRAADRDEAAERVTDRLDRVDVRDQPERRLRVAHADHPGRLEAAQQRRGVVPDRLGGLGEDVVRLAVPRGPGGPA